MSLWRFVAAMSGVKVKMISYVVLALMTQAPRDSWGCFPVEDIFSFTPFWLQPTSLQSRIYIVIGQEADDVMTMETEGLAKNRAMTVRCMRAYGDHRYLVRIDENYEDSTYQCLQFTPLTPQVIRQRRTKAHQSRKRVDCIDDIYTEDEAVIVAYQDVQPQPCPLSGGYQLIMHQGMAVAGHCLDSAQTYNPRIQFECDRQDSGKVLVDFGRACEPPALTVAQKMRGRHLTHLSCVSSWEEDGFTAVLLHMRDQPYTFWCLHYRQDNNARLGAVTSEKEEFLSTFLTVDGRCSSQAFGDEDVPRNTSMFGFLASYRPASDLKCKEKTYLQNCKTDEGKCFESTECPSICGRCKPMLVTLNCSFSPDMQGTWKTVNSKYDLEVTINKKTIKTSSSGEFSCRSPPELGLEDFTYPLVQEGAVSTCMPYYACAQVHSPAQGMLTFRLYPSVRDPNTGAVLSCRETHDIVGHIWPVDPEKAVTMVNLNKLKKTPCNQIRSTYPTILDGCRMAVHECLGTCQTLNVTFDLNTCGNDTRMPIETSHTCFATMDLEDGVKAILTKSSVIGRYLCWVFGSTRLFVAPSDQCNQDAVSRIYSDLQSHITYDPFNAISLPLQGNPGNRSCPVLAFFLICLCVLQCLL